MPWAAVIGSPISHSLSPQLHQAAWEGLGLGDTWRYERRDTSVEDLPEFLGQIGEQCRGLSVTMPLKQAVIPLLDVCDPLAQTTGSVNTVIPSAGVLTGFNTDVHGIVTAIRSTLSLSGAPAPRNALVLGAGATAASALAALASLGVARPIVAARRFGGPASILGAAGRLGIDIEEIMWYKREEVARAARSVDLVISTLPAGVADDLAAIVHPKPASLLLDVVYSPRTTALVSAFKQARAHIVDGVDMLIYQAALQVRLMTGYDPDIARMRDAVKEWR